jgi:hypothetical protein
MNSLDAVHPAAHAILPWLLVEGVRAWKGKSCC